MIVASSLALGVLFAAGLYLMLSGNVQRVAIGFILLSNGVNLMVVTSAGLPAGARPPLLDTLGSAPTADPLAQAFVLTAIVIGFGTSAFLLAIGARTRRETGSDELAGRRSIH